jgi:hypothetical protein
MVNTFQEGFFIVIIVLEESGQDQLPRQPKSSCRLVWVFYCLSSQCKAFLNDQRLY